MTDKELKRLAGGAEDRAHAKALLRPVPHPPRRWQPSLARLSKSASLGLKLVNVAKQPGDIIAYDDSLPPY